MPNYNTFNFKVSKSVYEYVHVFKCVHQLHIRVYLCTYIPIYPNHTRAKLDAIMFYKLFGNNFEVRFIGLLPWIVNVMIND